MKFEYTDTHTHSITNRSKAMRVGFVSGSEEYRPTVNLLYIKKENCTNKNLPPFLGVVVGWIVGRSFHHKV